jgi:hypothetical protein
MMAKNGGNNGNAGRGKVVVDEIGRWSQNYNIMGVVNEAY